MVSQPRARRARVVVWLVIVGVAIVVTVGGVALGTDLLDTGPESTTSVSPASLAVAPSPSHTPLPTSSPSTASTGRVVLAAGGDLGATAATGATLAAIARSDAEVLLALGDLSYGDASASEWCEFVSGYLGSTFPVELVVGNHEDDDRKNGYIGDFADCLPDRMRSTGTYAAEYYFDVGGLARVILIGAGNDVAGEKYDYPRDSAHYRWLQATIDEARAAGIPWVIVGSHKPCLTAGEKSCEVGADLYDLLLAERVDLVVHGHDHNYQRSKQLTCATPGLYRPECVADDGSDGQYEKGAGSVFAVVGATGGSHLYAIDDGDPEIGYLASWNGATSRDAGRGYLQIAVTAEQLVLDYVGTTTGFTDHAVIDARHAPA